MKKWLSLPRFQSAKKSWVLRAVVMMLCASMVLGMFPLNAVAFSNEEGTITKVLDPAFTAYTVEPGTALAEVGLPPELEIRFLASAAEGLASFEEQTGFAAVEWIGEYDPNTAGEYTLTAEFTDSSLAFLPMPAVRVTVKDTLDDPSASLVMTAPLSEVRGEEEPGVDYSVVCKLTPYKTSYLTGESIQFTLSAQFSTPGEADKPQSVKLGIPLPDTTPAVQLPMFYLTGSGEHAGEPMYSLSYGGLTTDLYLKTNDEGQRWIEFELDAGSTVQGTLAMVLPNGVSDSVPAFTLTPVILSAGDYGTNKLLPGGTTAVTAEFGWNNVKKSADIDNIGVIGSTTKDPDRITYLVTADSQSSGINTGRIFTDHYVLTDTVNLSGLHYVDGALTQSEADGISTFSIDGTPVLEIAAPLSALQVTKQVADGLISAFDITYTVQNTTLGKTDGSAAELPNLNLSVGLLLSAMRLNSGTEDTKVTNTADFDAYSPFGDHHHSSDSHTAYTQDRYDIKKSVYSDADCLQEIEQVSDDQDVWYKITATNNSSGNGPFSITDELPAGMIFQSATPAVSVQSGQTLTWNGVEIPSMESRTFLVKVHFDEADFVSNPVHNTAVLLKNGQKLASDFVDVRYLAGVIDDASIIYEKNVDKTSAGDGEALRYTITARNEQASAPSRLITITDKWPGAYVRPVKITNCTEYELFDAANNSYTLEEAQSDSVQITTIKLYNVLVPKGGGKVAVYIDGIVTEPITELPNAIVGSEGQNLAITYTLGVDIKKAAYKYDDVNGIGAALTNIDAVLANQVVCYQMKVKNLTGTPINGLTLTDKLPAGLTPVSGTVRGVSGQVVIQHGSSYAPLALLSASTPYTTGTYDLAPNEEVVIYLFAKVSDAAIANSKNNQNCITNAAYVNLPGGLVTGDATANIYTFVDRDQAFYIQKSVAFIADFDEDLTTASTRLFDRVSDLQQWNKNDIVWGGAYVGYKFELINRNTTGANQDPVRVYELIDTLPAGMEFVGVCINGSSTAYKATNSSSAALQNLGDQLILDGETGTWSNSQYPGEKLTCHYDAATNQVHITFNQDSSGSLPVKYHSDGSLAELKPYIYLIARVKEDTKETTFHNTVDAKVGNSVKLNKLNNDKKVSIRDGNGDDDGYKYISSYVDVSSIVYKPGIDKELIGHYFPADSTTVPENTSNEDSLFPGETLRFQLEVGTGVVSGSGSNRVHASLQDFVVTDILPAEYVYRPNSTLVKTNVLLDTRTGVINDTSSYVDTIPRGTFEPTIETLPDGRTKLTWTFSGLDKRLFVSTGNYYYMYFLHLITYDTDWNTRYAPNYGNYTNTATVTHNCNFESVYNGLPNYDDNSISATEVVNAFGAAGTSAIKAVTNEYNDTAFGNDPDPVVPVSGVGKEVTYTLQVTNATTSAQESQTKALVIIDELPRGENDTGVVNRVDRGSELSVLFGADPMVSVYLVSNGTDTKVDPLKYSVLFGNSAQGLNSGGDWSNNPTGGRIAWAEGSEGKNAVRIAFDPEFALSSGESIVVNFKAVTAGDADPGEIAWNSFGYSYKALAEGKLSGKIYAEPQRVGIQVPGAELTVTKEVTGDAAPAETLFSFVLKKDGTALGNVKYSLNGDTQEYRTGEDGIFSLAAGQTATFYVPPGGGYTVEETLAELPDNFDFVSALPLQEGDGTAEDESFSFKETEAGETAGVRYINLYTAPPVIDLTVEKQWSGDFDPDRPEKVAVQLYGDGVPVEDPILLSALEEWKYTWTGLDNTVLWTVEEVSTLPEGYLSLVTGDNANGFVIVNTYTRPLDKLVVSKTVTGGGDPDTLFTFRFTFSEDDRYAYEKSDGTTGTIVTGESLQLKHGESVTITIPRGVDYAVIEDSVRDYLPVPADRTFLGTMGPEENRADYLNRYAPSENGHDSDDFTGNLIIRKTVIGEPGDRTKKFPFTVFFDSPGSYSYIGSESGTIRSGDTVQLAHGESITILNLPAGTHYSVTEGYNRDYIVISSDSTGMIYGNRDVTAAFTNSFCQNAVPNTGADDSVQIGFLLMGAAVLGTLALVGADWFVRRRQHERKLAR